MIKLNSAATSLLAVCFAIGGLGAAAPAFGQSAGSYTSGSSFNPVQTAINQNAMNAAIRRQALGKHPVVRKTVKRRSK